jgi:hypothetical protein
VRLVLLVLLAVVLLYAAAFVRLGLRLRRRSAAAHPAARAADRALFGAATVGAVLFAYGRWAEPRRLEVTTVAIPLPELAAGSAPIRIVQLSDLHSPSNLALHETLATRVRALRPHAIVFTGDAVNTPAGLEAARALFARLGTIAPTYAVRGNRDVVLRGAPLFDGTGAVELDGATAGFQDGPNRLVFVGAATPKAWRGVRAMLRATPKGTVAVVLGHSPDRADDLSRWGADLYLAGHTHGGQVAFPGYGALWTASAHGKRFEWGRYRVGETWMYVNRGIGMEAHLPKVRFLARPELTVLELRPASGARG